MKIKNINYFDIGLHKEANEIDSFLKLCDENNIISNIYGIEAHPEYCERLKNKYKKQKNVSIINNAISNINLNLKKNYYQSGKTTFNFSKKLSINKRVLIPGVGTSCFYKKHFKLNMSDFKIPNMSDPYIGAFAFKQKIPIISISRKSEWLKPLNSFGKTIWKNNPYSDIDILINETFKGNKNNIK